MLDQIVHYLRTRDVPFRLFSYPSPEPLPEVATPALPPGGLVVETQVLLVGGRATIACMPVGTKVNLPRLALELETVVVDAFPADLPPPYSRAAGRIPPFGGAMGLATFVDEEVSTSAAVLVFTAFSPNDYFEVPYDDFARLERPRVSSFAIGGELPEAHEEEPGARAA